MQLQQQSITMHMFISFLVCYVFVLHVPWIEGNCCGCVDVNSVTTCISGELDRVPVILNPSVETLIIHKNPIRIVGSEISHYKKLTYIDISQNEINFLSSSSFKFNQKLVHINLSSNNITNITSGIFGTSELPLKFLHTINLRNNSVAHVDSSTFDNTGNIELLDLGKNQLVHVNLTTTGLLNLKYLLLDNNLLTLIPVLVFGSHSSLRAFRLSANKGIKSIPDFSFQSVGSIELLDLSGCRISEVGTNAFYGLSKLISLNLTNNILATIPSSSFQSLGSLETLKIGGNIFETIANSSFVPLANLKYLEIINVTTLASIQQDAFSFSANIEEIVVSQCRRLTYIPETIFHHTLMLRVLDLRVRSPHHLTMHCLKAPFSQLIISSNNDVLTCCLVYGFRIMPLKASQGVLRRLKKYLSKGTISNATASS